QCPAHCQRKAEPGRRVDGSRKAPEEVAGPSGLIACAEQSEMPQRLKPLREGDRYGTPEGVPFQGSVSRRRIGRRFLPVLIAVAMLLLSACGGHKTARSQPVPPPPTLAKPEPAPPTTAKGPPAPTPAPALSGKPIYVETGLASWYGPPYNHHRGSNGEIYDQNALTAAHRTLPLNSMVRVTNVQTKQSVVVRITDRGPFIEDRIVDLSLAAAKAVDVW